MTLTLGRIAPWAALGAVALFLFGRPTVAVPGEALSVAQARALAGRTIDAYFPGRGFTAEMLVRIAAIESDFNPTAVRVELAIGDASVGLMQTLIGTAEWLATARGYRAFGVPDWELLMEPAASMYFGAAYLDYLTNDAAATRGGSEETIVRGYNGGPGGAARSSTLAYWEKYRQAEAEFG